MNPLAGFQGRGQHLGRRSGGDRRELGGHIFGKGQVGQTAFHYFIDALRQNNVLRVLAEPNLMAISGQEASFLAGGEFPIPVTQGADRAAARPSPSNTASSASSSR